MLGACVFSFNEGNPTGRYELDLEDEYDRGVAVKLAERSQVSPLLTHYLPTVAVQIEKLRSRWMQSSRTAAYTGTSSYEVENVKQKHCMCLLRASAYIHAYTCIYVLIHAYICQNFGPY